MTETIEWISVKDALPSRDGLLDDENEYVLVVFHYVGEYVSGESYVSVCGYGKDRWDRVDNFGVNTDCITHWAYLPNPPIIETDGGRR